MQKKHYKLLIIVAVIAATVTIFSSQKTSYASLYKSDVKADIEKVLSLKVKGYKKYTLKEFGDYITDRYEKDNSLWKARQHVSKMSKKLKKQVLSDYDYNFLTVTIPCTESESNYEYDRVGQIPPDFSDSFDVYSKSYKTKCHFEYCVRYSVDMTTITVGHRDLIILNVKNGMKNFVKNTSLDPADKKYKKRMQRCLDRLVAENTCPELKLTVFHCE